MKILSVAMLCLILGMSAESTFATSWRTAEVANFLKNNGKSAKVIRSRYEIRNGVRVATGQVVAVVSGKAEVYSVPRKAVVSLVETVQLQPLSRGVAPITQSGLIRLPAYAPDQARYWFQTTVLLASDRRGATHRFPKFD